MYVSIPTPDEGALHGLVPFMCLEDGTRILSGLRSQVRVVIAPCGRSVVFIPDDMPREALLLLARCRPRLRPNLVRIRAPRLTVRTTTPVVASSPVERALVAHRLLLEAAGRPLVFHEETSGFAIDVDVLGLELEARLLHLFTCATLAPVMAERVRGLLGDAPTMGRLPLRERVRAVEAFDRCLRLDGDAFACGACTMQGCEWDALLRRLEDVAARRCDELDDRRDRLERIVAATLLPFTLLAGLQTVVELWEDAAFREWLNVACDMTAAHPCAAVVVGAAFGAGVAFVRRSSHRRDHDLDGDDALDQYRHARRGVSLQERVKAVVHRMAARVFV